MARSKEKSIIHFEVLQNGIVVAKTSCWLHRNLLVTFGPGVGATLRIPFYPLSKNLAFARISKGRLLISADIGWQGFVSKGGKIAELAKSRTRRRRNHVLRTGDLGSINVDDLQVIFKIERYKKSSQSPSVRLDPAYRPSIFSLFIDSKTELRSLFGGIGIATALALLFVIFLKSAEDNRPKSYAELDNQYIASAFHPNHLSTSPEALHENLNRKNYFKSVYNFYKSFTQMLMGWPIENKKYLFESSQNIYKQAHLETQEKLQTVLSEQEKINQDLLNKPKSAQISIPTILGESTQSKILRTFHKIDMAHASFAELLAARKKAIEEFKNDEEYDFANYKKLKSSKEAQNKLSQITPFHLLTNEEEMYDHAKKLGQKTAQERARIKRLMNKTEYVTADSSIMLTIKDGVNYVNFLNNGTLLAEDGKIDEIDAIEFGSQPKPKAEIKEPLIGEIEPALIEKTISKYKYELQLCYELALRRDKQHDGRMEWSFRIDTRGKISDIELVSTSINDRNMVRCVRKKIASWNFPRPRRGSVEVSYPFLFTKSNG